MQIYCNHILNRIHSGKSENRKTSKLAYNRTTHIIYEAEA